jgi:glycosyltransferase involved in cell wall biosynthesis
VRHRVLHLLGDFGRRGTAQTTILAALAGALDPQRYELAAWYLDGGAAATDPAPIAGVRIAVVPFGGGRDVVGAARFARRLAAYRPSIVHLHVGGRSRVGVVRALGSARLVAHLHAGCGDDGRPLDGLEAFARSADAVVATSRAVAELAGAGARATIVHPGVPIAEEKRGPEASQVGRAGRGPTIGVAARLEPVKGIDVLLRAVAALRGRPPGLRVLIAGCGSAGRDLLALRDRLALAGTVEFLGWRDDLAELHDACDVFALPSRHEGFGLAALQAMAAGLPVVASRTGGVPELVDDGVTGLLAEPGDAAALAAALDRLISDPASCAAMGAAARRRAQEHFTIEAMARCVAGVYEELLTPA